MSFISKFFKKKPEDWNQKIHDFFQSPKRVQAALEKEIDLWSEIRISEYMNLSFPPVERFSSLSQYANLPKERIEFPSSWSNLSLGDFLSPESVEILVEFLLLPAPHPKLDIYKKFIGQKEISQIIAKQLQSIVLEINNKLNPLSQVFKSSGWEDQMFKIIESFVPSIQSSIASKLAGASSDMNLGEILNNSIRLGLGISMDDFSFPPESDWRNTVDAWKKLIQQLGKDQKLESGLLARYEELKSIVPESWKNEMIRDLFFEDSSNYKRFRSEVASLLAEEMIRINQQNQLIERSVQILVEGIQG